MNLHSSCLLAIYRERQTILYFSEEKKNSIILFFATLLDKLKKNEARSSLSIEEMKNINSQNTVMVILADDDQDDRLLFEEVVNEINSTIEVQTVGDGLQLMQILNEFELTLPDIIFLDLNMPGKGGKECLEEIRKNKKFKDVPVVIYSTSANFKDVRDTHSIGANLYVRKPNSFNGLISIIKRVFSLDLDLYHPNVSQSNFLVSTDSD